MRYVDRCLGLPIIALDTAEEIGITTHYVTDPTENRVIGFVVSRGNGLAEKRAYLFGDVVNFGEDMIILNSQEVLRPVSMVEEMRPHLRDDQERPHRKALTSDGQYLGTLTEFTFDERSARVLSHWLTPGSGEGGVEVPGEALVSSGDRIALLRREAIPDLSGGTEGQPRGAEEEIYPEATREPARI